MSTRNGSEMSTRNGDVAFSDLPEGCIANVISLTTPEDACKFTVVSLIFRSAAESDAVWKRFLPSDYQSIIARSEESSLVFSSMKELYLRLCDNPLLIDGGKKSFSLEKWSGKKCFMLSARDLTIVWADTPSYWGWTSLPESRFPEVAELRRVCWLEIRGKINTNMLSTATTYSAYLVFKFTEPYGFDFHPAEASVGIAGSESCTRNVYLDPGAGQRRTIQSELGQSGIFRRMRPYMFPTQAPLARERDHKYPKQRGDQWYEVELGEYINVGGEDGELEINVMEVKAGNWKGGLVIQGIEIRPKVEEDINK